MILEEFDEDIEIELFSVLVNVPKQEDVEVMSDCVFVRDFKRSNEEKNFKRKIP